MLARDWKRWPTAAPEAARASPSTVDLAVLGARFSPRFLHSLLCDRAWRGRVSSSRGANRSKRSAVSTNNTLPAKKSIFSLALKKLGRFKILREPIVTSARKVRMHSPRFVLAQSFFLLLGGQARLRRREKLALWYDGKRERPHDLTKRLSALRREA